jgi:hypothetical protein
MGKYFLLTQSGIVKNFKPAHDTFLCGFVSSWQAFRDATRRSQFFLHTDTYLPRDFHFTQHFTTSDLGGVWLQCVDFLTIWFLKIRLLNTCGCLIRRQPISLGFLLRSPRINVKHPFMCLARMELTQGTWKTTWGSSSHNSSWCYELNRTHAPLTF